jgi:hypothetical protein
VIKATKNMNWIHKGAFFNLKAHTMTEIGGEIYVFAGKQYILTRIGMRKS